MRGRSSEINPEYLAAILGDDSADDTQEIDNDNEAEDLPTTAGSRVELRAKGRNWLRERLGQKEPKLNPKWRYDRNWPIEKGRVKAFRLEQAHLNQGEIKDYRDTELKAATEGRIVRFITSDDRGEQSSLPCIMPPGSLMEEEFRSGFQPDNPQQRILRADFNHLRFYGAKNFGNKDVDEAAMWMVPPEGGLKTDVDELKTAAEAEKLKAKESDTKLIGELAARWYGFEFSRFTPQELEKLLAKSETERDLEMLARGAKELGRRLQPLLQQLESTFLRLDQYMSIYTEAEKRGSARVPQGIGFSRKGNPIVVEAHDVTANQAANEMEPHRKIFDQALGMITKIVYRYVPGDVELPKKEINSVGDAEAALVMAQEWLDQAAKAYTVEFTAATVNDRVKAYQTALGLRSSESAVALTDLETKIQQLQIDIANGVEPGKRRALLDDLTDWLADRTQAEAEANRVISAVSDLYQQVFQGGAEFLKVRLALDGSSALAELKAVVKDSRYSSLFESEAEKPANQTEDENENELIGGRWFSSLMAEPERISQEAAQDLLKKLDLGTLDVAVKRSKDFLALIVAVVPAVNSQTVPKDLEKSFVELYGLIETLAQEKAEETPTAAEISDVAFQLNNLFDQQLTDILDQARANIRP